MAETENSADWSFEPFSVNACSSEETTKGISFCECVIESFLNRPFSSLSYAEKLRIIEKGRPKEELTNLSCQSKGRKVFKRHFNAKFYESESWLCGCSNLNKLYCWPCLLFSPEKNVWNHDGFQDLNNLHKAQRRHKLSFNHITSLKQLKSFGKSQIENCLSEQFRISIDVFNEKVKKNRRIISHMIKGVCFLAKQELAFRGHTENQDSLNRGNYIEYLYELAENDVELREHLKNSTVFSRLSSDIQNDLIFAISELMVSKIKEEIKIAPFVALILDETTDISTKSQLSVTLRYVTDSSVRERFIGFQDVSDDRTANGLAKSVFPVLLDFNCKSKLIAQTYDGAAVMSGEHNGLQAKLRTECPEAIFVHCYAHKLNLVCSQSLSFIKECRTFFNKLSSFGTFFSKSIKRMAALDELVNKRFPSTAPTRWNFSSRLVETVNDHYNEFLNFMTTVTDNADKWDGETICGASGLLSILQDFDFIFFLTVLAFIFPHIDNLFNILQKKGFDIAFCHYKIEDFLEYLCKLREDFDSIWNKCKNKDAEKTEKRMRIHTVPGEEEKHSYKRLYYEVVDVIASSLKDRFRELPELTFISLLDSREFHRYESHFPEIEFSCLKKNYGKFFDFESLKSELTVFYSDSEMQKDNVYKLFEYLTEQDLTDVFPEVYKLAQLIVTIPALASSSSAERSFSTLKRIKTYLRNSQEQQRMSSLSLLSIEKQLLAELRQSHTFYDDVIDIFTRRNRSIDLIYRK